MDNTTHEQNSNDPRSGQVRPPESISAILRWKARTSTFDFSNDTVIVTRTLLTSAADIADEMLAALKAIDVLWIEYAKLNFEFEQSFEAPVGIAWKKVRDAIAKAEGRALTP